MLTEGDYVDCWFIGGPVNNELLPVHRSAVEANCICLPIHEGVNVSTFPWAPLCEVDPLRGTFMRYRRYSPLSTDTPVFSCLDYSREESWLTVLILPTDIKLLSA